MTSGHASRDRDEGSKQSIHFVGRWRVAWLAIAVVAATVAVVVAIRGSARPVVANQSAASLSALAAALFLAAAAGAVALASAPIIERIAAGWRQWISAIPVANRRIAFAVLLGTAATTHVACSALFWPMNSVPRDDQADYLRVARDIAASDGPARLPLNLIRGEFLEDNRHPLYVAALALRPTFSAGKTISLLCGFALLMLVAGFAAFRHGCLAGGVAAILTAVNFALLCAGSLVACETMLAVLVFVAWMALDFSRDPQSPGQNHSRAIGRTALAGAALGFAYLTKASACFLFAASLVAIPLYVQGSARRRVFATCAFVAAFVFIASPLLVRNARVYGSPLHSFNNRLMFAESYDAGLADPDLGFAGNLKRYWERHSAREIIFDRGLRGLLIESFVLLRSLGPVPFDSGRAPFGLIVIAAAAASALGDERRRFANLLLAAWTAIFVVFFAWYLPIAASDRFLVPLIGPILMLAADGIARTARWIWGEPNGERIVVAALVLLAAAAIGGSIIARAGLATLFAP